MYTLEFYKRGTNESICFVKKYDPIYIDHSFFTKDINKSINHDNKDKLILYGEYAKKHIFKVHPKGSMSEHEYNHVIKDYFNGINKKNIDYRVYNKLKYIRKIKLDKIKKRII